jgi:hypothetical protein
VIGPALDFTIKGFYFFHCFAWATPRSNTPAQFFQMLGRVREIGSHCVHYYVSPMEFTDPVLSPERLRSRILQGTKQTVKLGIRLTGAIEWNVLDQKYEAKVADETFLNLHVENLYERDCGRRNFAKEFAQLIQDQQGEQPVFETKSGDEQAEKELKEARAQFRDEKKDKKWALFQSAPNVSDSMAKTFANRHDKLTEQEQASLERYYFCKAYGISEDEEITREAFEKDKPKKRERIYAHEDALLKPLVGVLLHEYTEDHSRLNYAQKYGAAIADVNLKALPREMHLRVFRVFGFCESLDVAQCLHGSVHSVTSDFCERTFAMDQIPLLGIYTLVGQHSSLAEIKRKPEEAHGDWAIRWFRSFLLRNWQARLRKDDGGRYAIFTEETLSIIKKRKAELQQLLPPTVERLVHSSVPLISSLDTLVSFVIAFTPRMLAALENQVIPPVHAMGMQCVSEFEAGLLLIDSSYILYSHKQQHWLLSMNQGEVERVQCATSKDVVNMAIFDKHIAPLRQGRLYDATEAVDVGNKIEWTRRFANLTIK